MKISPKHFALGAIIAFFPTLLHVRANIDIPKKPKPAVLAYESNYLSLETIPRSLNSTPNPEPEPQQTVIEEASRGKNEENLNQNDSFDKAPTPTPTIQSQTASYTTSRPAIPEDIYLLIDRYSGQYRVNKDMMLIIAKCESGYHANAVNGPYAGIYQFLSSTWVSNRNAMQEDSNPQLRFNAEEAIKTAAFKMSRDGYSAWPACSQKARTQLSYNN